MPQIIEYSNHHFADDGVEYLWPFESQVDGLPFSKLQNMNASEVSASLSRSWACSSPAAKTIAGTLAQFAPRSIYLLKTKPRATGWLLLELNHHILFIPEYAETPARKLAGDLAELMSIFGGYSFGHKPHPDEDFLMPCSGFFQLGQLETIDESTESYFWEGDETVLGGSYFFSSDCGNQLCCRTDGSIAKWNMGSNAIENVYPDCQAFATEFKSYYTGERGVEAAFL